MSDGGQLDPIAPLAGKRQLAAQTLVPDDRLLEGLRPLLDSRGAPVELHSRTGNPYTSTCPSEFVTVRCAGADLSLFCKYQPVVVPDRAHHRRGVAYEARVHRELLAPLGAGVPRCFGTWHVPAPAMTCLVLEAVQAARPLRKLGSARVVDAASWAGSFHADARALAERATGTFPVRYDETHVTSWLRCAERTAAEHRLTLPWLPMLADAYAAGAVRLAAAEPTIVHGEYYPMNILATPTDLHPIDWESAGIGPGEIDLASLTMGWPHDVVAQAIEAYVAARWDGLAPDGFDDTLRTARIYLCLRMLGDPRGDGSRPSVPFFDYLAQQARACGLLAPAR